MWMEILNITRCTARWGGVSIEWLASAFTIVCLSPRVVMDRGQKWINPFVSETTESACICIIITDITKNYRTHLRATYGNTGQLFQPYKILSAVLYCDLPDWISKQQPQNAKLNLCHWANSTHHAQVTQNQLVINQNVSHVTSVIFTEDTVSSRGHVFPGGLEISIRVNYHNLKGKYIDVHFLYLIEELYCELNYHD